MILTEYYVDGDNHMNHVLCSFPFTEDLISLRSCLASEYAYTYSNYAVNLGIRMRDFVFPSDLLQVPNDLAAGGRKTDVHGDAE